MLRTVAWPILCVLVLLASGCTPISTFVTPDAAKLDKLPADHGVVVLRVADLAGGMPLDLVDFESHKPEQRKAGQWRRVVAHDVSDRGISQFVGVMEAGQYSLSALISHARFGDQGLEHYGRRSSKRPDLGRRVESTPDFGTFTVSPGRITNLGTVVYYPAPSDGSYREMLLRTSNFPGLDALLAIDHAGLQASLTSPGSPLGWDDRGVTIDSAADYPNLVRNPMAFDQAVSFDDEVVILSRLGSMLRGKAGEGWRPDAVDSDTGIVFVDKNAQGNMLAVTEDGGMFFQFAGKPEWLQLDPPDAPGRAVAATLNDIGQLHVFCHDKHTITIFEAQTHSSPAWTAKIAYRSELGWQTLPEGQQLEPWTPPPRENPVRRTIIPTRQPAIEHMSFLRAGEHVAITADSRAYVFDKTSAAITNLETDFRVQKLSGNGQLLITGEHSMVEITTVRRWTDRLDGGWHTQHFTMHASNPYLAADGTIYSIVLPDYWRRDQQPYLAQYRPDTRSWRRVSTDDASPLYCNRIFPSGKDGILIIGCSGTNGRLYEFDTASNSFTLVREPAAFWEHAELSAGDAN